MRDVSGVSGETEPKHNIAKRDVVVAESGCMETYDAVCHRMRRDEFRAFSGSRRHATRVRIAHRKSGTQRPSLQT